MDLVSTSGSSGKPAVFYLDKRRGASEWAYVCDSWRHSGYSDKDWRAVVRGVNIGREEGRKWLRSRATGELLLSAFDLDEASVHQYWELITKYDIRYLHGYPSSLSSIAKYVAEVNPPHANAIQGVFTVSESLLPSQSQQFGAAFPNALVLPFYGMSERVAFAQYLPQDGCYEFYPLYGYVEVLDDEGKHVAVGERGRIIATGLRLKGMPLIRYDTGDRANFLGYSLDGNVRISNIQGKRAQESLVTKLNGLISTSALNLHSAAYSGIFTYRFRQQIAGEAELLIVPNVGATQESLRRFEMELQEKCSGLVDLTPVYCESLAPTPNGKMRLIEQLIEGVPGD